VSLLQWQENDWPRHRARHPIVSLLEWQPTRFSHEPSLIRTFYDLPLFTTLTTTAKMICTADRVAYTICLERIEHILYAWKQEDMSWNSFTVEYLKLNLEEDCLNDKDSEPASKADNDWPRRRARHPKWACYNDKPIVDLLIEPVNEQNKPCYTRVVDRNQNSEPASMATHPIQQRTFYYSHLLRFTSIHDIDGNSKMICTADRMKHVLYASRGLNIYYMPGNTKIWAETRSPLNIWSWIERKLLEWQG